MALLEISDGQEQRLYPAMEDRDTVIHPFPPFTLLATQHADVPTAPNLKVINEPPCSYVLMDGLPVDQQLTWFIPVVRPSRKAADRSSKKVSAIKAEDQAAQSYGSLISKLVKSSAIYALSSLASPFVTLVLAPFLTHQFSPTQYGALAVLITFITLVSGVTQLGLGAAFFRAYNYDYESERDRLHVISTFFMLLLLITLPVTIILALAAPLLAGFLLNDPSLSDAISVSALVILVQNLTIPGLYWLRAEGRAVFFTIVSLINILVSAGATILFVGSLHMGIEGALLATGAGYAVIVCSTVPLMMRRAGIRLRFDIAKSMLAFGFPHALSIISGWVLQLSDRYLLGLLGSLSQTASYAVAYSLGGVLATIVIAPFSLAWWSLMYTIAKRNDAQRVFQSVFRWFSIALLFAAFGFSTFGVVILDLFFPPSYHATAPVIPIIALSMVFNGVNIVTMIGPSLKRKTLLTTVALTSSALINIALNLILIPYFGAMGAAIATLVAYIALALVGGSISQRIYPVPFEIGRLLIAMAIGIAIYIGSNLLTQNQEFYLTWGLRISGFALYGVCLVLLGKLPSRSYEFIHTILAHFGGRAPA